MHHEREAKAALDWSQKTTWVSFQQSGDMNSWIDKLRQQWFNYEQAGKQTPIQEYDERTRVKWLLESLKSDEVDVVYHKNQIKQSNQYMHSWNDAVKFLADCEYIGKDTKKTKRARFNEADLAALGEDSGDAQENKRGKRKGGRRKFRKMSDEDYQRNLKLTGAGRGKSGVEFRWYNPKEYRTLNQAQRKELTKWRGTKSTNGEGGDGNKDGIVSTAVSAVAAAFEARFAAFETRLSSPGGPQPTATVAAAQANVAGVQVDPSSLPDAGQEDTTAQRNGNDSGSTVPAVATIGGASGAALPPTTPQEEPRVDPETEAEISAAQRSAVEVGLNNSKQMWKAGS